MGMWVAENEGAKKFWLSVLTELQHRGVRRHPYCLLGGLKGFPDAIKCVFSHKPMFNLCIVHMCVIRSIYVSWKRLQRLSRLI